MSINAEIYCGGPIYSGGQSVIDDLRASGNETVVAWTIHVSETADLHFNDTLLVQNGKYVGSSTWDGHLAALKQGGSVSRLLFGVGSGGVSDFHNIQALIAQSGSAPGSPLYEAFAALIEAIPSLDGFDLDDEDLFDHDTTVTRP